MTRPKPARLKLPPDATHEEAVAALQRLRRQQLARTVERELGGKPPWTNDAADQCRDERQQQVAAGFVAQIDHIRALAAAGRWQDTETDVGCADDLVAQLVHETTD